MPHVQDVCQQKLPLLTFNMSTDVDELWRPLASYLDRTRGGVLDRYAPARSVRIQLVEHTDGLDDVLDCLLAEDCSFLGLDTEWSAQRQVALLQLAAGRQCLLLRPCCLQPVPPKLQELLWDERVLKVGVGLGQDIRLIESQFGLGTRGAVELSALAAKWDHVQFGVGLASLCRSVLGKVLPKDHAIRCSNWGEALSEEQIFYAACDATVAVDIATKLYELHREPSHDPQAFCSDLVDRLKLPRQKNLGRPGETPQVSFADLTRSEDKVRTRSKPLYDSCLQLAPDGTPLAYVPRKRAEWYVQKGLAILVSEDPFEFQLLFEPKAKSSGETCLRENRCASCGKDDLEILVRFNVVPHAFRTLLVSEMESRSHHDILLLCKSCFVVASAAASRRRERLFKEHDISVLRSRYIVDLGLKKASQAAHLLLQGRLPADVTASKLALVRAALGRKELDAISQKDLVAASQLESRFVDQAWRSPEEQLVSKLALSVGSGYQERCQEFVVCWRKEFVHALKPKCLPVGWSVNHRSSAGS